MLHLRPLSSVFLAFDRRVNECHPCDAILDASKIAAFRNSLPGSFGLYRSRCFDIDVCKSLDIAFRLPSDQASNSFSDIANVIIATPERPSRSVRIFDDELVRMLLIPLERCESTVCPNI